MMDDATLNRIAVVLALAGALASVVSIVPMAGTTQAIVAVAGYGLLVAALHTVRPPTMEQAQQEGTTEHMIGAVAAGLVAVLGLLLVAATVARFGDVRYLGAVPFFIAENFTFVTGPFLALLAVSVVLSARGKLHLTRQATGARRASTLVALTGLTLASALFAIGVLGEPWQAPYLLAVGAVVAWIDATRLAGLPTLAEVGAWLERGETEQSRWIVRVLARVGNGSVLVFAVGGMVLFAFGYTTAGLLMESIAAVLLTLTTHAAAGLTEAVPAELGEELAETEASKSRLRLLGIGPLIVAVVAGLLTSGALASMVGGGSLESVLGALRPAMGAALVVLAGVNLARAGLPTFQEHSAGRRAVSTVAMSVLAASLFFSVLIELGIMSGPITQVGVGLVFNYAAVLAVAVFVLARGLYPIPGTDLEAKPGEDEEAPQDDQAKIERSLMAVYIASGLFVVGALGLLAMAMFGQLEMALPDTGEGRNAAYLAMIGVGVVLLMGLAVVYFQSRQLDTPHEDGVDFERDYTAEEVMRLTVLGVSGTLAFVLGFLGVLVFVGQLDSLGGLTFEERHSTDFFVFAILVGIGPAGYLHNREQNRIQAIDDRLPEFLRDLAESQRTGMTLTQAVITASKGNYGALTPEIKKMAAQIEWGVSFERALTSFAERVDTPLVQRTVSLVIEASNSGGEVMEVLEAAAEDAREIQQIEHERQSGMQIYVMIIYIAFLVFIGVIAILNTKFMPEVAKAVSGASGVSVGSITFEEFDMQVFQTLFFHAAIIQGLGGGFVAGSMEEGRPAAGLKHAFAMTMGAYLVFRFMLGA